PGTPVSAEAKLSLTVGDAFFGELLLRLADRGDLWMSVGNARNGGVVDVAIPGADPLGAGGPFLFGFVGQHRSGDEIANGVDPIDGGQKSLVDLDASPLIRGDSHLGKSQPVGHRN